MHVLGKDGDDVLRRTLDFKVNRRGKGQPRKTWRRQVEEEIRKFSLNQEDALNGIR